VTMTRGQERRGLKERMEKGKRVPRFIRRGTTGTEGRKTKQIQEKKRGVGGRFMMRMHAAGTMNRGGITEPGMPLDAVK